MPGQFDLDPKPYGVEQPAKLRIRGCGKLLEQSPEILAHALGTTCRSCVRVRASAEKGVLQAGQRPQEICRAAARVPVTLGGVGLRQFGTEQCRDRGPDADEVDRRRPGLQGGKVAVEGRALDGFARAPRDDRRGKDRQGTRFHPLLPSRPVPSFRENWSSAVILTAEC